MTTNFQAKKGEPFDWKAFQKHMGYTDEEMKALKNDPEKMQYAQTIFTPEIQNKWLIFEVVESHGCEAGLKVGDRIYFEGLNTLDVKRSSNWCLRSFANAYLMGYSMRNLIMQGVDPNEIYADHCGCLDAGSKFGLGRVIFKAYAVDKSDLDKLR
jgi:uncharacterized repeat protein (TIGR04076 family)